MRGSNPKEGSKEDERRRNKRKVIDRASRIDKAINHLRGWRSKMDIEKGRSESTTPMLCCAEEYIPIVVDIGSLLNTRPSLMNLCQETHRGEGE